MAVLTGNGADTAEKNREKLKEPGEYQVILLNDDYTTMEFVVEILMLIFHKSEKEAGRIMMDIHRKGKGIVGMYPWDIALTKANEVHAIARQHEYPLRCIVE
ncbi:MAG: ATP-dependent Clp protease adaptor ClpS [Treponema sp.]|jgi:ATP-dependent Clp protease adaptor protein ClpS|nr:ATP-dependent Clp protease adaptor ClpS [Treponema sp.]